MPDPNSPLYSLVRSRLMKWLVVIAVLLMIFLEIVTDFRAVIEAKISLKNLEKIKAETCSAKVRVVQDTGIMVKGDDMARRLSHGNDPHYTNLFELWQLECNPDYIPKTQAKQ